MSSTFSLIILILGNIILHRIFLQFTFDAELRHGAYPLTREKIKEGASFQPGNDDMKLLFPVSDECGLRPAEYRTLKCPLGGQVYPGLENPVTFPLALTRPYYKENVKIESDPPQMDPVT